MAKTGFIDHPIYLQHDTGFNHPENALRILAIRKAVLEGQLKDKLIHLEPSTLEFPDPWIQEVHTADHFQRIKKSVPKEGQVRLDPDTVMGPFSFFAAQTAVAGVLMAIDRVMSGALTNAFCAVRPPGHHAEADRAMGFCLFNNVAVGACYLRKKYGLERVLIIDWDVHHGNGTQAIFYRDPSVFYFSTHQYPFYPGTGSAEERGEGPGEGTTLNCPLPSGSDDAAYLDVFERVLVPAASAFRPEFILVSAGFDAHRDDHLASMRVTEKGYGQMSRTVRELAQAYCSDRIVSVLEGGYHLAALGRSVKKHLEVLSA